MTTENHPENGQAPPMPLTAAEKEIVSHIREKHDRDGLSFLAILHHCYPNSSLGVIYRAYHGELPKKKVTRRALGLLPKVSAPVCPECGELHTVDECTQGKRVIVKDAPKPRKPRNRRAVNLDDPQSAAATLRKHASPEFVAALVRELERIE